MSDPWIGLIIGAFTIASIICVAYMMYWRGHADGRRAKGVRVVSELDPTVTLMLENKALREALERILKCTKTEDLGRITRTAAMSMIAQNARDALASAGKGKERKPIEISCAGCHHGGETEDPNDGENGYACAWLDETKSANCRREGHWGWVTPHEPAPKEELL